MGGKDVIIIRQLHKSLLQPAEVQSLLKEWADEKFNGCRIIQKSKGRKVSSLGIVKLLTASLTFKRFDITHNFTRREGVERIQTHNQRLSTISQAPDVISMSFVPITSLLSGLRGSGFLSHATNLYLRCKPPIEEFLEFQIPRQWAPMYGDLPLGLRRKKVPSPALHFSLTSPRLFVNITPVESGNRHVTGLRLYLEGKKSNHLAIHPQHLSSLPKSFQLSDEHEPLQDANDHLSSRQLDILENCGIIPH